jgi:hypothetical protein
VKQVLSLRTGRGCLPLEAVMGVFPNVVARSGPVASATLAVPYTPPSETDWGAALGCSYQARNGEIIYFADLAARGETAKTTLSNTQGGKGIGGKGS